MKQFPASLVRSIEELLVKVSGSAMTVRMWEQLMTEKDRRSLQREVQNAPLDPEVEEMDFSEVGSEEMEVQEGLPGKLLHRCYYLWDAVGMWMRARKLPHSQAIIDLAHEHGFLTELAYRRMLEGIGAQLKKRSSTKRPTWDREERVLRFEGRIIRRIRSLKVASNIIKILDAFEQRHWPHQIDAPKQISGQVLHDAVYSLNRGLKGLAFHVTSDGAQINWGCG